MSEESFDIIREEKGETAAFNMREADDILRQSGITQDNPDYKRYYNATMQNVHNSRRFATYNDETKQGFINFLSDKRCTIDLYEQASKKYHDVKAENIQDKSTGLYDDYSYSGLAESINRKIIAGVEMRQQTAPTFPEQFYDETGAPNKRVVLKIEATSAYQMITDYAKQYQDIGINFDGQQFSYGNGSEKSNPQRFFNSKADKISHFMKQLAKDGNALDLQDSELTDIIKKQNYDAFKEFNKQRGMNPDTRNINKALRQMIKDDPDLFVQTGKILAGCGNDKQAFLEKINETKALMEKYAEKYHIETQATKFHEAKGNIDRIILSARPYDLATQSTFRDWGSCMSVNRGLLPLEHGFEGQAYNVAVERTIGAGSIIAYGYDSKNPTRMVSRMLIQPYENEKGDTVYIANEKVYGEKNDTFKKAVVEYVDKHMNNADAIGVYHLRKAQNGMQKLSLYNDGNESIRGHLQKETSDTIAYFHDSAKELDFSKSDIKLLRFSDFSDKDKVIFADNTSLEKVKLPDDLSKVEFGKNMSLSWMDLPKDFAVPENWSLNACDISQLKIDKKVTLSAITIPEGMSVPDGSVLSSCTLNKGITYGQHLTFKDMYLSDVDFKDGKIPDSSTLDGIKGITNLTFGKDLTLKNMEIDSYLFETLPKDVTFEQNIFKDITLPAGFKVPDGSELINVKFAGPVTFGKDIMFRNMTIDGEILQNRDITENINRYSNITLKNVNIPDNYDVRMGTTLDSVTFQGKARLDSVIVKNSTITPSCEISGNTTLDNITFKGDEKDFQFESKYAQKSFSDFFDSFANNADSSSLNDPFEQKNTSVQWNGTIKNTILPDGFVAPSDLQLIDVDASRMTHGDLSQASVMTVKPEANRVSDAVKIPTQDRIKSPLSIVPASTISKEKELSQGLSPSPTQANESSLQGKRISELSIAQKSQTLTQMRLGYNPLNASGMNPNRSQNANNSARTIASPSILQIKNNTNAGR